MKVKSTLARTALAGGVAMAALGMGAGIAVADPNAEQSSPNQQQDQQSQQAQQGQSQQQGQAQPGQPSQQAPQLQPQGQPGHGFSLFGTWIPLPF